MNILNNRRILLKIVLLLLIIDIVLTFILNRRNNFLYRLIPESVKIHMMEKELEYVTQADVTILEHYTKPSWSKREEIIMMVNGEMDYICSSELVFDKTSYHITADGAENICQEYLNNYFVRMIRNQAGDLFGSSIITCSVGALSTDLWNSTYGDFEEIVNNVKFNPGSRKITISVLASNKNNNSAREEYVFFSNIIEEITDSVQIEDFTVVIYKADDKSLEKIEEILNKNLRNKEYWMLVDSLPRIILNYSPDIPEGSISEEEYIMARYSL